MNNLPLKPLLILFFGAMFMFSCEKGGDEDPDLSTIKYTLSSQEDGTVADIAYTSGIGPILLEDVTLPWSISFTAIFKNGDELTLEAESSDQDQMSAHIFVNDTVVTSESATHLVQISYIKGLK